MIYVFSGTGNTVAVARELERLLTTDLHEFTADELRNPESAVLSTSDSTIVWMFPTYSWGVPPVVRAIIAKAKLRFDASATHVAVTTCGDDVGCLATQWRGDMKRRGIEAGAVYSVEMPNTYVMMKGFDTDSPELAARKMEAMPARAKVIADAIASGNTRPGNDSVVAGSFGWLKTHIVYPWFTRRMMSPTGFRVRTEACISCGKCVNVCPMDNVTFDAHRHPVWGDQCAFCTACYHVCPRHAVEWRKATLTKRQKNI